MNNKCIYFVEGACEQQLISALKEEPAKLIPGKIRVFNVVKNLIPKSQLLSIQPGTIVAFAFDTDVLITATLKKNIERLRRYCGKLRIVYLPQVLTLEDELERCSDVKSVEELTKSSGRKNFKTDFCRMNPKDCRAMLERHDLKVKKLWMTKAPEEYSFMKNNAEYIKVN